jgi:hypothetical protein
MSDLYSQMAEDRGALERLARRIPGFSGYLDRALRRTADRMVRDQLAGEIKMQIDRLAQIEKLLLDGGGLMYMSRTASAKTKIQTYHDRIKAASPGYSGFFEAVKVDEADMEALYRFDEMQFEFADRFRAALDALQAAATSKQGIDEAILALDSLSIEANNAFSRREEALTSLSK